MGMSLAQSYALEEEKNIQMFKNFLDMGAQYINQINNNDQGTVEIQQWMVDYFAKLTHILGIRSLILMQLLMVKSSLKHLGKVIRIMILPVLPGISRH